MSVEWDILLLCSRVSLNAAEQVRLQDLGRSEVDWRELFNLAEFHRTLSLVYRQLKKHCPDLLSQQFMGPAKDRLWAQGIRNMMMGAGLLKVLAALGDQGIQAVPFKGPVFTKSVFGDLALRSYCDLDILISDADLSRAVEVIRGEGFSPLFPLTSGQLKVLAKTDNEYPLQHPVNGMTIDLQWELTGSYSPRPLYLNTLYQNLSSFNFLGKTVSVFSQEDLLVYLCIHGNQHVWEQLDQVCCVAETIKTSQNLDWNLVWERAENLRVVRVVCIGLLLASTLLTVELPADVTSAIKINTQAVVLAEERAYRLAQPLSDKRIDQVSRRFILFHWKCLDSPWQAIRYGCHIFFAPTRYDWQKLPLPVWMSPLHYIYRPLRLILAGIWTLLPKY